MEKRQFSRVSFHVAAIIKYQEQIYEGEISDLSLRGVFLQTNAPLELRDEFEIEINLMGNSDETEKIHIFARVVRKSDGGFGILFERTDLDSFVHLKNIVDYNGADPEKTMEEFCKFFKNK